MIPLRDVIPSRTTPFVTVTIIVLNVLIFLYQQLLPVYVQKEFVLAFALIPADFRWLNVFTSMFLHGGWGHILGNMLYLWIFGDNVEDRCGHARFVVFYLLCGFAAGAGQILMNPASMVPTIGASGAIAGVMGAYFVLYPHSRVLTFVPFPLFDVIEVPAIFLLGFWFLMQLFSAGAIAATASSHGQGGVAFMAHVAGFVMGALTIFLFRRRQQPVEWR